MGTKPGTLDTERQAERAQELSEYQKTRYKIFSHFAENHGIYLLESEIDDVFDLFKT